MKVGTMKSDLKASPDFLGIGMQKAGTSWMYEQLKKHPSIWLPERKELHFFDSITKDDWNTRRQRRALKNIPELTSKLNDLGDRERNHILNELEENVHLAREHNDLDWYRNFWLKVADQTKTRGEITPAYSILNPKIIQQIYDELNVPKIILILRNPVERSWSQYKMMTERKSNDPETVYMKSKLLDRGRAQSIIENWEKSFEAENIFIGFYDDIKERPYWFLENLCAFLNIEFDRNFFPDAEIPVRVSRSELCPKHIQDHFISEYACDLKYLADRFQGHTLKWLDQYSLPE